jgi:hypothetical protein
MIAYLVVAVLLILGFGSAIYMAKRVKPTEALVNQEDLEDAIKLLAHELSKQFALELRNVLQDLQLRQPLQSSRTSYHEDNFDSVVTIDDRIIPVSLKEETVQSNVIFNQQTEATDTKLSESKNKLASFLKKKKDT